MNEDKVCVVIDKNLKMIEKYRLLKSEDNKCIIFMVKKLDLDYLSMYFR